jgi:molybdenum cofactor synthesis domain-containing protein
MDIQPTARTPVPCTAAVIAGGAAVRMDGAVKALLAVGDRTILERVLEALAGRFREVLLVVKEPGPFATESNRARNSCRIVLDRLPVRSSLTGVHAALADATTDHVFVTAGDTPLLRPELVAALLAHVTPESDVVLPQKPDGYFEPLCAIYSRRCLPFIEAQLAAGDCKIIHFFDKVTVRPLPVDELLVADPDLVSFLNANTPEELRALRETAARQQRPRRGGPVPPQRISRDQALERIRAHVREHAPATALLPLDQCHGLVCAKDLFALHATPAEACSSVDGYVLSSAATHGAARHPAQLRISGEIRPSTREPLPLAPGVAARILTGGRLPEGTDCVLPDEEAIVHGDQLTISTEVRQSAHVRPAGSDLKAGTRIVRRGEDLSPQVLAALAVSGVTHAQVFLPPRTRVLAIGNELAPLGAEAQPGRIPADNLLHVSGLLRLRGVPQVETTVVANDLSGIAADLDASTGFQCIVTTGGTGPGDRDFLFAACERAGFQPLFHGLTLTPGKSVFAATRGQTLLFALPGTPWAVFALMHALVLPSMCWLRGRTLPAPTPVLARPLALPPAPRQGWERLVPCTITGHGAELHAQPLLDRNAENRLDMLAAQGLLIISPQAEGNDLLPLIPIWENRRGQRLV